MCIAWEEYVSVVHKQGDHWNGHAKSVGEKSADRRRMRNGHIVFAEVWLILKGFCLTRVVTKAENGKKLNN